MITHTLLRCLLVTSFSLALAAASAAAQITTRDKKKPPEKRNFADMMGGGSEWSDPKSAPTPAPTENKPEAPVNTTFDAAIASLKQRVDMARSVQAGWQRNPEVIQPFRDFKRGIELARDYYMRYERMQERLYVADFGDEAAISKSIARFMERWGTLAPRISSGNRQTASITAAEWTAASTQIGKSDCPLAAKVPTEMPKPGITGDMWACLSDAFFADLAKTEAAVNDTLFTERTKALTDLRTALDELDRFMKRNGRRAVEENVQLQKEFTARLHKVYVEGMSARHAELTRLRDAQKDTPFQKFLGQTAAVVRPNEGTGAGLLIPAGRRVRATLDNSETEAVVVAPTITDVDRELARRLHDVHYQVVTAELSAIAAEPEMLRDHEFKLADKISDDLRVDNPRETTKFREGMARKVAELKAGRATRAAYRRGELQSERQSLLKRIANR
jgi:hypothetical protein